MRARPGAFQPDAGGEPIAEQVACERMSAAETAARERLDCDAAEHGACPEYIRPAGAGQGCFVYDEASIAACEALLDDYASCDDFAAQPCIVTARPDTENPACGSPQGGAGGAGGSAGAPSGAGGTPTDSAGAGGVSGSDPGLGGAAGADAPGGSSGDGGVGAAGAGGA